VAQVTTGRAVAGVGGRAASKVMVVERVERMAVERAEVREVTERAMV